MKFSAGKSGNPKGRPKGTPNKSTATVKDILQGAFELIGGEQALALWARKHRSEFYSKLWVRMLPADLRVAQESPWEGLAEMMKAARERAQRAGQ